MFVKKQSICKGILVIILLCTCPIFVACNQEETKPFQISDQAIQYVYPMDNILSLKSVISDSGDTENRFILEFDAFSKYISKESVEATLRAMEEEPVNYQRRISGESVDHIANTKVQAMYGKDSIFLILYFEPNVECSQVVIKQGNLTMEINGPWESPDLFVMNLSYMQDGAEGVLFRTQEYDEKNQKWNACIDQFAKDMPPAVD